MKMKKLVSTALALVMVASLSACGIKDGEVPGKTLYGYGQDVVALMVEVTRSEEYVQAYTSSPEINEILQNIGAGEYTTPKAVYSITMSEETLLEIAEMGNLDGASKELQDNMKGRVLGSVMTQVNALAGVNNLAASSVCSMGKTFVSDEEVDNQIYLYTYDNGRPIAVTFVAGEGGAVSASGTFVIYDEFTCGSAEEIEEFFSEFEVEVEEVHLSK